MDRLELEKFESKVFPEPNTGCWLWGAAIQSSGYGSFWAMGRSLLAHRVSYEHYVAEIPDTLEIDHLCRVRRCVNPKHLEAVTRKTNVLRGISPSAAHAKQTHCVAGHEFTEENTYIGGEQRFCRLCMARRQREYRLRKRRM